MITELERLKRDVSYYENTFKILLTEVRTHAESEQYCRRRIQTLSLENEKLNKTLSSVTLTVMREGQVNSDLTAKIKELENRPVQVKEVIKERIIRTKPETVIKTQFVEVKPTHTQMQEYLIHMLENQELIDIEFLTKLLTNLLINKLSQFNLAYAKAQIRVWLSAEDVLVSKGKRKRGKKGEGTDPSDTKFQELIENNEDHHWFLKAWVALCNASYTVEKRGDQWGVLSLYKNEFTPRGDKPTALKYALYLKKQKARDHLQRHKTRFQEPTEAELTTKFKRIIKKYEIDLSSLKELN